MTSDSRQQLPNGVSELLLVENRVFARVCPDRATSGLVVRVGNKMVRMNIADEKTCSEIAALECFRPHFMAEKPVIPGGTLTSQPESIWAQVNALPDWTLPGSETLQVAFNIFDKEALAHVASPIKLPPSREPLFFSALVGSHRAKASLKLTRVFERRIGKTIEKYDFGLGPDRFGGHLPEDYAHISLELPASADQSELHLTLAIHEYLEDGSNLPPYLFLSNPLVHNADWQGGRIRLRVAGEQPTGRQDWLAAPLPGFITPGNHLELFADGRVYPLLHYRDTEVSLLEDHGYYLLMRASRVGRYRFLLDGEYAFSASLGPDAQKVAFPARFLDGESRGLAITDFSGAQRLFATHVSLRPLTTSLNVLHRESRAPYPGMLMGQGQFRFAALKTWLEKKPGPIQQTHLSNALQSLEEGVRNVRLTPFAMPKWDIPDVSVILVVRDRVNSLYLTLCSLLLACKNTRFEVIIVDNASGDAIRKLENTIANIRILHNPVHLGFGANCNKAVDHARGKYVLLLGEDCEVTSGWLDALVDGFERFGNVGLVGARLIYSDGRLLDGGGQLDNDASSHVCGHGQNPWDPRFSHARPVDFVNRTALMMTRANWQALGGMSEDTAMLGVEEIDLALRLRMQGLAAWYIPASIVYRREPGEDMPQDSAGLAPGQAERQAGLRVLWAKTLAAINKAAPESAAQGHVLFIDHATPRPDRDAGGYASLNEMQLVRALGYRVTFLPRDLSHMGAYTDDLERDGIEVIRAPFYLSAEEYLIKHAAGFDAFYVTRYYVAAEVLGILRQVAPGVPVLFNNADLHFLREQRAAKLSGNAGSLHAALQTRAHELAVMREVDLVLSYSEAEHALIRSHAGEGVRIAKCPWVVTLPETVPQLEARAGLSFLGSYDHAPNPEAVKWFVQQVMPLVEKDHPDLALHIYGAGMGDRFRGIGGSSMRLEGFVKNVADAYDRHRIFIAPLLSGAGIKGKVLAAFAHGIPVVLSPIAAEGIGCTHGLNCLIATNPQEWRAAIHALVTDEALWHELSRNGRALMRENYLFDHGVNLMRQAFASVGLPKLEST